MDQTQQICPGCHVDPCATGRPFCSADCEFVWHAEDCPDDHPPVEERMVTEKGVL